MESAKEAGSNASMSEDVRSKSRLRNPWSITKLSLAAVALGCILLVAILHSFSNRQLDPKGCRMSYMRATYVPYTPFSHGTRFAKKYSLYLYREYELNNDQLVQGLPVLFIPGNAGSYKQGRSLASEASFYYANHMKGRPELEDRQIDFFVADFSEDFTAFHGQTLLDQAEYLNDAIEYILSLYRDPLQSRRPGRFSPPRSVVLVGHSMGGIVARLMLQTPNYHADSIDTIITLAAPHARPPVSFDRQMTDIYNMINGYWRKSYTSEPDVHGPLSRVVLVSIAGGGLDTTVPSDYSSTASFLPQTHGFTVFTSTIPHVWTGMDHLAITWCDQLRKSVVAALYDIIDPDQPSQVVDERVRMRAFKNRFLTGMEELAEVERSHYGEQHTRIIAMEDADVSIVSADARLAIRSPDQVDSYRKWLIPIPTGPAAEEKTFTFLSDGQINLQFCRKIVDDIPDTLSSMLAELPENTTDQTRLMCKTIKSDLVTLPASRADTQWPFDETQPFSYLQHSLDQDFAMFYDHIAITDESPAPQPGFLIAEINDAASGILRPDISMLNFLLSGLRVSLPAERPLVQHIKLPGLYSSLLAYRLEIDAPACDSDSLLFRPLVRQYIADVYESRFFVNVSRAEISLHGVAPYLPPRFTVAPHLPPYWNGAPPSTGLSLQIWTDPTCKAPVNVSLEIDALGSLGKLWMRYRTLFATLPLLVVALALRKQFQEYDRTGHFMSFAEGMNQSLKRSLPITVLGLTSFSLFFASLNFGNLITVGSAPPRPGNSTEAPIDYAKNNLLIGTTDPFFWFLLPAFTLICFGLCTLVNWVALLVIDLFASLLGLFAQASAPHISSGGNTHYPVFSFPPIWFQLVVTGILAALLATIIPNQLVLAVLCVLQLATCMRLRRLVFESRSDDAYNLYNYAHSILVLLLWVLPLYIPVLIVWVRNLTVGYFMPISPVSNITDIMPFVVLVQIAATGRMMPRLNNKLRYITNGVLCMLALEAAIFGVSYAYMLHKSAGNLFTWLFLIHLSDIESLVSQRQAPYSEKKLS